MAIKTLRVFQEFTSEGYVPMPPLGNIDYGYTVAGTFPGTTPATFQTDDPDIDVTVTEMTDFYVWIRSHGSEWNINYTRNVRVYPDSPLINNVVMGIIIANSENGLPAGGTAGQILSKIDGTDFNAQWIDNMADWTSQLKHTVRAGVALTKGQAVYVSSANGTNMIVSKASNNAESTSSKTLGLVAQNLALNGQGFVITEGLLAGLDTSTATIGDAVWLGTDGNLIYGLANKPHAPAHLVFIGIVTRVNNSNGEIFIKVQNGFELDELHNVLLTSPANNETILFESASNLWKNKAVQLPITLTTTGSSGASTFIGNALNIPTYTLVGLGGVPTTRALSINGTSFDLSADRSWNVGTVTSVGATVPTGFAVSGVPITTSGTIAIAFASGYSLPTDAKQATWDVAYNNRIVSATLPMVVTGNNVSIYQSSPTSNGYLSSTDWTTFNSKQNALSGTGFVKIVGTTISYDNTAYTPASRLLTINGISYDLTADRSWTITPGSGMRNVQTFTATSGQTTFTITGGYTTGLVDVYVNGARLSSADFTATNGTTVVLGVGVVTNDIIDIVSYTASLSSGINGSGTTNYISKFTASNVLGNSLLFDDGNAVGIGTTSLSAEGNLFLGAKSATEGGQLVLQKGTSQTYAAHLDNYTDQFRIIAGTNTASSTVRMTIDLSSGATTIAGALTATTLVKSGGTASQILAADGSVITAGTNITISGGVISSSGGGSLSGSGTTNYHAKWSSSTSLSASLIYDNATSIAFFNTANGSGYAIEFNNNAGQPRLDIVDNGVYTAQFKSNGGIVTLQNNSNNAFVFGTNGTERMRITSLGNFEIPWLNNMVQIMNFDNSYRMGTLYQANNRLLTFFSTANDGDPSITFNIRLGAGSSSTDYGTEKVRINSSGNVGIGVTSPNGKLHVNGRIYGVTTSNYADFNSGGIISYGAGSTTKYIQMGYDTTGSYGWIQSLTTGVAYNNLILNGAAGDVGIRTLSPSYTLHVNGSVAGTSAYVNLSDVRFKKNIKPLNDSLSKVLQLNGISFDWNKDFDESMNLDELNHIGLLAQEVEKIIPQSVFTASDKNKTKSVAYSDLVPVLIEAIKELNAKIEAK